jgi:hypothetical protein
VKRFTGLSSVAIAAIWLAFTMSPAAAITLDEVSLKFLPSETRGITFIDVAAPQNVPLVQDALKQSGGEYPRDMVTSWPPPVLIR